MGKLASRRKRGSVHEKVVSVISKLIASIFDTIKMTANLSSLDSCEATRVALTVFRRFSLEFHTKRALHYQSS